MELTAYANEATPEKVPNAGLTVTDAVWVATALLHRAQPAKRDFSPAEIVSVVLDRCLTLGLEKSVWTHVRQHCVGNKKPQPNTACILFDPGNGMRRLWRDGDAASPGKKADRCHPEWLDLPQEYRGLREWYEADWNPPVHEREDALMALAGTWNGEPADRYLAALRAGWEQRA